MRRWDLHTINNTTRIFLRNVSTSLDKQKFRSSVVGDFWAILVKILACFQVQPVTSCDLLVWFFFTNLSIFHKLFHTDWYFSWCRELQPVLPQTQTGMIKVRDDPKLLDDVLRYPNLKEEVGGSFPNCEISSLLDRNLLGGQSHHVLWCWPVGLLSIWFYLKKTARWSTFQNCKPLGSNCDTQYTLEFEGPSIAKSKFNISWYDLWLSVNGFTISW